MTMYARTIVALLFGCHVVHSRRQDVFETSGGGDGEAFLPHHALEEAHAVHPLAAGLRVLPIQGNDKDCVATCNEDKLPTDGEPEFYECWGDFKWECDVDESEVKMSSKYTCHGAFTVLPGHHGKKALELEQVRGLAGAIDESDKNSSTVMTICEGSAMSITKSLVSISGDAAEDKEGIMSIQGGACFGVSKMIKSDERGEFFFGCEDVFITGSATKPKMESQRSSPHSATDDLDVAAKYFIQEFSKHGAYAATGDDTPMSQSSSTDAEHKTSTLDEGWSTETAAGQHSAGARMHSASKARQVDSIAAGELWDKGHRGCEVTCNGGPLPLYGWWPCRGKTEFKCKGEKSDTSFELHFECLGVAFPAFKTCKGVATQHITISTDDESTELMNISTGKFRAKKAHAHGWKGQINYAFGHSSVHSRSSKE